MPSAAIQAFRRVVTIDWPKEANVDAQELLVQQARAGHAQIMARQGNPAFSVYANSPGNTNIDGVVLPGPIVYTYSNVREIVALALTELQKASPVDSGDYARSHTLFVNGAAVDVLPASIKPADEIMIANPLPYSRRLEVGRTKSGRSFVMQVPDRIYERVFRDKLLPKYTKVALIRFEYVTLSNAYTTKGGLSAYYGTTQFRRQTQSHYFGTVDAAFAKQWNTTGNAWVTFKQGERVMRRRRQKAGKMNTPAIIITAHT